ncbi:MAG: selenide, water dikinase SelD [Bacteroidetes bacterium]|nr:selenide, water dikinase SelD [Bacteroidota bacterium]
MQNERLTKFTRFSGCGAKLGPGFLDKALCGLRQPDYPELLADFTTSEDSGIYQINETQAIVQTVDFFPPIVDDPFMFGRIAAANSLSDIYACGAVPLTAVGIVCFPKDTLDISYLRGMSEGGLDALAEAGTALVGGHSIDDPEPKFGYSVTGIVDIDRILLNNTATAGDILFLTKPIGTGTINAAFRADKVAESALSAAEKSMSRLNKGAAEALRELPVSACTDVTGFGLAGHLCEMISGTKIGISLNVDAVPLFPHVLEYIAEGHIPGGTYRNKEFRSWMVSNAADADPVIIDLLFDPQTSGGLLFSIDPSYKETVTAACRKRGAEAFCIGEVNEDAERITLIF